MVSVICKVCGKEFSKNDDYMMYNYNKHIMNHQSWRKSIS